MSTQESLSDTTALCTRLRRAAAGADDGVPGELGELHRQLASAAGGGSHEDRLPLAHPARLRSFCRQIQDG